MSVVKRPCPDCKTPIEGEQIGSDLNWFKFTCLHCDEVTYEDVKYCINLEDAPAPTEL